MSTVRLGKVGWTAAITGALIYCVASDVLPWALVHWGMTPRAAAGYSLQVLLFVSPIGLLAAGAGGLLGQSIRLSGWFSVVLLVAVPGIVVSAVSYGVLAKGIAWARGRARVLFWVLALGPALYGAYLLAMFVFIRG